MLNRRARLVYGPSILGGWTTRCEYFRDKAMSLAYLHGVSARPHSTLHTYPRQKRRPAPVGCLKLMLALSAFIVRIRRRLHDAPISPGACCCDQEIARVGCTFDPWIHVSCVPDLRTWGKVRRATPAIAAPLSPDHTILPVDRFQALGRPIDDPGKRWSETKWGLNGGGRGHYCGMAVRLRHQLYSIPTAWLVVARSQINGGGPHSTSTDAFSSYTFHTTTHLFVFFARLVL